jgi:hypothetical protein
MAMSDSRDVSFLKDSDWSMVADEICRVLKFTPLSAAVRDGHVIATDLSMPYASVEIESPKITGRATGFITNKTDFAMLWAAIMEPRENIRGVRVQTHLTRPDGSERQTSETEVWIVWTKSRYKFGLALVDRVLPKLIVMVCLKGAYELTTDNNVRPELSGEERFLAEEPLVTWTPEVMVH